MNRIAVQTGGPEERYGIDKTYQKVKEWGFDAVDVNLDHLLPGKDIIAGNIPEVLVRGGTECMELFRPWGEASKHFGIDNYQAHAPFPSLVHPLDSETNQRMVAVLQNTLRGCNEINCRNLIIHPREGRRGIHDR